MAATSAHALRLNRRAASRENSHDLFEHSPVPIWEEDFSEVRKYVESLQRVGISDVQGWLDAHPEDLAACRRAVLVGRANRAARDFLAAGRAVSAAEIAALADGSRTFTFETVSGRRFMQVQLSVMPSAAADWSRIALSVTDITALKQAEVRARQGREADVVARLAGGVAHDLNNILTIVSGYGELLAARLPAEDPLSGYVRQIREAGERAADLTYELLAYSRRQILQPQLFELSQAVRQWAAGLLPVTGERIEVRCVPCPETVMVRADAAQFQRVLRGLAAYARDAMPEGGTFTIETSRVLLTGSSAADCELSPGVYGRVAVRDTGPPMDEETCSRIFEPFFSNRRKMGTGFGLGLAAAYGIVKQSGGHIAAGADGQGNAFAIYLPCAEGAPQDAVSSTSLST